MPYKLMGQAHRAKRCISYCFAALWDAMESMIGCGGWI